MYGTRAKPNLISLELNEISLQNSANIVGINNKNDIDLLHPQIKLQNFN